MLSSMPLIRFKHLLKTIDYPQLTLDETSFKNMSTKCRFVDSDYGEFWAYPGNIVYKRTKHRLRGAKAGGDKNRVKVGVFVERLSALPDNHLSLDVASFRGMTQRARFIDDEHGECFLFPSMVLSRDVLHPVRGVAKFQAAMRVSIQSIKDRIKTIHGDAITLVEASWVDTETHCLFRHVRYGEWKTSVWSILRGSTHPKAAHENRLKTFQSRYGGNSPICSHEVARRARRSVKNLVILKHWKTGEDVECTGSFEYAVIDKLNQLRLDYRWQIPIRLSDSTYYCDLYVVPWDLYIEIKGFFFPRAKAKWEEFTKTHPNAELWERGKVVEFTGRSIYLNSKAFKAVFVGQHTISLST